MRLSKIPVRKVSLAARVALGRVYYSQLSNPISMDARIYLKGWLSSNWNMTGQFIR